MPGRKLLCPVLSRDKSNSRSPPLRFFLHSSPSLPPSDSREKYEELHNDTFVPFLRRERVETEHTIEFERTPLGKVWVWMKASYDLDESKVTPSSLLHIVHAATCFLACIFSYALSNSSRPPLGNV